MLNQPTCTFLWTIPTHMSVSPLSARQLSLFRRLSFSRAKQTGDKDPTPLEEEPPAAAAGSSDADSTRARGPRSGACTVL